MAGGSPSGNATSSGRSGRGPGDEANGVARSTAPFPIQLRPARAAASCQGRRRAYIPASVEAARDSRPPSRRGACHRGVEAGILAFDFLSPTSASARVMNAAMTLVVLPSSLAIRP